jgi:hypothetical protein
MRSARFSLSFLSLFLGYSVLAQQVATPQQTSTPSVIQDPQAVSVLNQALIVAGGTSAISAVTDYTATGQVTYHWRPDVQGSVTVRGLGVGGFRLDANLPKGIRSWGVFDGQTTTKSEEGTVTYIPSQLKAVPSSDAYPYEAPLFPGSLAFPWSELTSVLGDPNWAISYKGIVQLEGHPVHDIQVQFSADQAASAMMNEYHTKDFFIDTSTLQLVMTQDNVPKHIIHQIRYSKYTAVSGMQVPFSIDETMGGQRTWDIQLSQIKFNAGLQDSELVIQ